MASTEMVARSAAATLVDPVPFRLPPLVLLVIAIVGLAAGLAATALAVGRGWDPGRVSVGAWTIRPGLGTSAIDPYARARQALTGAVPMAANEGVAFSAMIDDTGYRLVLGCTYRLSGPIGPTRFWTLAAADAHGLAMDTAAHRTSFTSATVIRDETGAATIEIGPEARPGNWLPTSGSGPMDLVLRFYGTTLADTRSDLAAATLPAITRFSCVGPDAAAKP